MKGEKASWTLMKTGRGCQLDVIGEALRTWRRQRGYSLQEVARRAGLSASYLSEIENGKKQPSVKTLEALATALNVSLDSLLDNSAETFEVTAPGREEKELGLRLRLARERKNLSVKEVAEAAGMSPGYLVEIERGAATPSLDTLRKLAEIVALPLADALRCDSLGDRIRRLRERLNISQAELARRVGVTPGFISQLESDKTQASLLTIRRISRCLGVSPCYLILENDSAEEMVRTLNPQLRELLEEPRVQAVLRMVCDMTEAEFRFLLQFICLLKRQRFDFLHPDQPETCL